MPERHDVCCVSRQLFCLCFVCDSSVSASQLSCPVLLCRGVTTVLNKISVVVCFLLWKQTYFSSPFPHSLLTPFLSLLIGQVPVVGLAERLVDIFMWKLVKCHFACCILAQPSVSITDVLICTVGWCSFQYQPTLMLKSVRSFQ